MEWYEIAVDGGRTVKFPTRALQPDTSVKRAQQNDIATTGADEDSAVPLRLGGIIKHGSWGWLSSGNKLEITALRTGQTIATYEFTESRGYESCSIRCVEELFTQNFETVLLAVCLECFRAAGGGCTFMAIYSIEYGQVLSCMELPLHITTAAFVSENCCRRSLLQNFDGCLAVGSEEGVILLLDLNVNKILAARENYMPTSVGQMTDVITLCQIADYNLPLAEIHRVFRQTRQDGIHFGLQVEVIDTPCSVQCLLPIDLSLGLAIGLEDGRLAIYDLAELQIINIATPQQQQAMSPVVKLSYLEPLDDPRHCLYVLAIHENDENLSAVLHTLVYEKRLTEKDDFYYFESFLRSTVRLHLPLEATKSIAIDCQSVRKIQNNIFNNSLSQSGLNATQSDEDGYCLCALTWYSVLEEKNKLLIFDLNQWYKEEMPYSIIKQHQQQKCPSYLAGYILSGRQCALSSYLNPNTIAHFNSLQRYEEHFYPNSLSFDCMLLLEYGTVGYTWIGAQNKMVNILRASNSSIFLEPDMYFREILRARLLPQFSELNVDSTFSRLAIFDTILSVALEHNCFNLLRDCAKCWADGSFMGSNFTTSTGISLSTLTDWTWKRATDIKTRCNDLSKGLFDYDGYPLDQREQKELGFLTRQLKLLGNLLSEVLSTGKRYIPEKVFFDLETQYKSIRMASEYQDVLLWLLNIGLLPEMQRKRFNFSPYNSNLKVNKGDESNIQYPYKDLKNLYGSKRNFFASINENLISKKTGSCRLLFIDALIAHECKGDNLRECWLENGGNGLYPPPSIEAMLRVLLVPEMEFESKCAILLYFFLDLHMTIDEQMHKEIVESFVKFPSVFKLTATLIKTVQSLWNLDHGQFMPAVDEFISPFNNNQTYPQWMVELLIESLLTQNAATFALRILEARPTLISPTLKLNTLLANDLISEAFHFARTKHDDTLLEFFFNICLRAGKYGVIRDLALTEREGQLVQRILRQSKTNGAENLHFVYLLQKSKYIEAVSYLDELSRTKNIRNSHYGNETIGCGSSNTDTPNLVLSAFNTTMAPVTQGLTDVYFRIKNRIKKKEADNRSPVPLSCQLIKQNANNLLGGIYHSSALSAHFATYYWGSAGDGIMNYDEERKRNSANSLLSANNAPFLRKPQAETCNFQMDQRAPTDVSYPQPYRATEKRTLVESELEREDVGEGSTEASITLNTIASQPRKRRRLLGQEIVEDLGHFVQTNKTAASQLTALGFDLQPKDKSQEKSPTNKMNISNVEYLTQPLPTPRQRKLAQLEEDSRVGRTAIRATSELQSILKTSNTPDRNERARSLRRELTFEENKNLRFKLPATEIGKEDRGKANTPEKGKYNLQVDITGPRFFATTTTVDETEDKQATKPLTIIIDIEKKISKEREQEDIELVEDEVVDEVVIEVHPEKPSTVFATTSPLQRRDVLRTPGMRSNNSPRQSVEKKTAVMVEEENVDRKMYTDEHQNSASEVDAEEDEDFYSPLSSRNSSLITENIPSPSASLSPAKALNLTTFHTAKSKIFPFSGPQPRKPLARLSAERSQSRTPEKALTSQKKDNEESQNQQTIQSNKTQPSSGYVSLTSSNISTSTSMGACKPAFEIKSVMSLVSSSDFTPRSSSSKLHGTEKKSKFEKPKMTRPLGKLTECSTVVDSFSVTGESNYILGMDEVDKEKTIDTEKSYAQLKTANEFERPIAHALHADTTLGMSSYEFTLPKTKSQMTTQVTTTSPSMSDAAKLRVMETVEVFDLDEEAEMDIGYEHEIEEEDKEAVPKPETDLFAEALGITVQQSEFSNEGANSEDSNDIVALYENKRAKAEKLAEQATANESNNSSVIILSSSESSRHMSPGNQRYDSYSESDGEDEDLYDDEYGEEDNVTEEENDNDNENVYENNDYDHNWDEESNENESSSSIVQVHNDESNNSRSGKEEVSGTSSETTSEFQERRERELNEKDKEEEEYENRDTYKKKVEIAEQNLTAGENISGSQSEGNTSSQPTYAVSLESESQVVVEEAESGCSDFEELVMRETIDLVKSEDEQPTNVEEKAFYTNKSVFMQNDAEITIQELKVSTYKASTEEVYEELSGDIFYCDARSEASNEIVAEHKKGELGISVEVATTSSKAVRKAGSFAENPSGNVEDFAEKSILNVKESDQNENAKSVQAPSNDSNENNTPVISNSVISAAALTKATELVEEKEMVSDTPIQAGSMEEGASEMMEEEEEIKLHVDEGDLSEFEDINTLEKVESKAEEAVDDKQKTAVKVKTDDIQSTTQSPKNSPEHNQMKQTTAETNKPDKAHEPQEQNRGSPKTPVGIDVQSPKRECLLEQLPTETVLSTPTTRKLKSNRGTSVPPQPPVDLPTVVNNPIGEVSSTPQQRNKRGISMPPQIKARQELETSVVYTPETRTTAAGRSLRVNSVQPSEEVGTPRTRRLSGVRGMSMPRDGDENNTPSTPIRTGRGTSMPPVASASSAKIVTRRRSALLDAINESVSLVDSPSARTRSRMRLNSADSELDSSLISGNEQTNASTQNKRARRTSVSSSISEQPGTPSGGRRTRSSINVAEAETVNSEKATDTPKSVRRTARRRESLDTTQTVDERAPEHEDDEEPSKTNMNTVESTLYSSSRRLTRTQLAIMEKSAALRKNMNVGEPLQTPQVAASVHSSPASSKRVSKRRSSRSTMPDSDEVESVSSRMSNTSGAQTRRVTRSSVKDKEENDDDLVSVASSVGSDRLLKRRSKESKISPNVTLTTIPEDEAEESSQSKRSRSTRKRLS